MKKILTLFSSITCLFLIFGVEANPYFQQPYPQHSQYVNSCVGRCNHNVVQKQSCKSGRFYAGAFGGANWLNIHNKTIDPKTHTGYTGAVSFGYKFNNGFRVEGEVAYRRNHLKVHSSEGLHEDTKITGDVSSWSYMSNFLYDFDCVEHYLPKVVPYVGFGIGYTHIHAQVKAHDSDGHVRVKETSNGLSGQAIAGIGYRLTNSTTLGVEYRYFDGKNHAKDHSVGFALKQSF